MKLPNGNTTHFVVVCVAIVATLFALRAKAEFTLSAYGGAADTFDSDVKLKQPNDTNLSFKDVAWTDESFESPIYYGLRLGYWFERAPNWGIAADFIHAKMLAKLDNIVTVTGTRNGTPVSGPERLGNTFQTLAFSHGHNLLTLNIAYRWFPAGGQDSTVLGRLQPYAGFGAGAAIPHVEVNIDDVITDEYQLGGPALQGFLGLNFRVFKRLSIFTEYKLSYADIEADLNGGGTLEVEPFTNHFTLGASLNF